jgi:peptide/nickel transport system ATP-binding protein
MRSTQRIAEMALLEFNDLSVTFDTPDGAIDAVKSVSMSINPGECLGIVGESGSGKSQSFLAAMGLLARNGHTTGSVSLQGQEILNLPRAELNKIRGRAITMIFQDPLTALTPHLRIVDQMAEVVSIHMGHRGQQAQRHCLDWLDKVKMPDAKRRLRQFPHQLSGGQRQRVMIAMAMLNNPKLLIADEPTTALDVTVQADILDLIAELQRSEGTAVALITHDMGVVARMCDRIEVMRSGEYVESGDVDEIFYRPKHPYTKSRLDAMPRLDRAVEITRRAAPTEPILSADNIRVDFQIHEHGGMWGHNLTLSAVDGVSFEIAQGETLGLVGESGCGKSTLARAVLQLIPATGGSVTWLGTELTGLAKHELKRHRKDLQIVFQDPLASLNPRMTVSASIAEPLITHRPTMSDAERKLVVAEMMEKVGLTATLMNRYPHELSGGQNQRVGIARAMINKPRLIICDEAVSALDVSVQAQILALLRDLQAEFGMAMIFISHDLSVVRQVADRIMVLYLGAIVELADRTTIFEDARHPYTRSLITSVPVPDPKIERTRKRSKLAGEPPSALDPKSRLRFLPSRLRTGEVNYRPQLEEIAPGHFVAEYDALEDIIAN